MEKFIWRTAPPTGTEGTNSVYVHTYLGSDLYGDGTRQNPYQSLNKAWNAKSTRPAYIIAIGRAAENMSYGNHSATIQGDFYGAFEFDGEATETTGYYIYGFKHSKIIIRNVPNFPCTTSVWTNSAAFAGVGYVSNVDFVGPAYAVHGVGGSPCFLHNCCLYFGCIGGITASAGIVISKPTRNTSYPLWLGGTMNSSTSQKMTIYDASIANRCKRKANNYVHNFKKCIFAKFAMIANDVKINYDSCLFLADSEWYFLVSDNGSGTVVKFTLSGTTSAERQQSLIDQLNEEYDSRGTATASRYVPTFTNCIFSDQTSEDIFNNPEQQDFSLKVISNGTLSLDSNDAVISDSDYIGAMPPGFNIPIYADSNAKAACWDNNTISGCLSITPIENSDLAVIAVNSNVNGTGEILSKVISLDISKLQLNGIFAQIAHQFNKNNLYMNNANFFGDSFVEGDILPVGRYQIRGVANYQNNTIDNAVIIVSEANTSFTAVSDNTVAVQILNPNVHDVIFVRCRAAIYARVPVGGLLQKGATYINDGNSNISYRGRTIVPGESFIVVNNADSFSATDNNYSIGILFDDTRVPVESPWVPAQAFGEYFVSKMGGVIQEDTANIPLGSGNPLCYRKATTTEEGYLDVINKNIMNQRFVQFAIKAYKYM